MTGGEQYALMQQRPGSERPAWMERGPNERTWLVSTTLLSLT